MQPRLKKTEMLKGQLAAVQARNGGLETRYGGAKVAGRKRALGKQQKTFRAFFTKGPDGQQRGGAVVLADDAGPVENAETNFDPSQGYGDGGLAVERTLRGHTQGIAGFISDRATTPEMQAQLLDKVM